MSSLNIFDGNAWRKANKVHVFDGSSWRQAKGVWVFDGTNWRKGYTGEKYAEFPIYFTRVGEYHHEDGYTSWGAAKQGYYQNSERSGYLFPRDVNSIRDEIIRNVPDFGSLVQVNWVSFAINRGGSGDWGSERTLRLKQTTKTSLTGPDAVNGSCDFRVSGGQGWKWDLQTGLVSYSNCLIDTFSNCINQTNGARNLLINSDNTSYGTNGWNWSYDYMSVLEARANIGITYVPK